MALRSRRREGTVQHGTRDGMHLTLDPSLPAFAISTYKALVGRGEQTHWKSLRVTQNRVNRRVAHMLTATLVRYTSVCRRFLSARSALPPSIAVSGGLRQGLRQGLRAWPARTQKHPEAPWCMFEASQGHQKAPHADAVLACYKKQLKTATGF